jgi:hypothetical protein
MVGPTAARLFGNCTVVLPEFDVDLSDEIEVRVQDFVVELRYLVLPLRPLAPTT